MIFKQRKVVLASASPRRLDILHQIGVEPEVCPTEAEEIKNVTPEMSVEDLVAKNAAAKARAASDKYPDAIIIGADTMVMLEGHLFGKPADETEAKGMLTLFSGRTHQVYTGICLIDTAGGRSISASDMCEVTFSNLSSRFIDEYVESGEAMGKAGAYGIQGKGALLVESVSGDYYTVVGLSVSLLRKLADVLGAGIK